MPGYGARFWADRTANSRRRTYPKFKGVRNADVVVIGGGLTGCTIAHVLAHGGLDVVLLEADRMAAGSTSGSLGAALPQPDAWFRAVEKTAGVRVARTAWKEARKSSRDFAQALKTLGIKCDLQASALTINARDGDAAAALKKEQVLRRAAGVETPWLSGQAARAALSTESAGAIRLTDAYTFDPVRAALGLAASAEKGGAKLFEQSSVRKTTFTRKYADVVLANGRIRTRGIVVATGEPGSLFGQLRRHVTEMDGYVVVTAPMPAAVRRETGARNTVLTESGDDARWLRWMPDDRAMFAGGLSKRVPVRQREKAMVQKTAQLMYELTLRYPAISGMPAEWGWAEPVVSTPDSIPWIGPHRNYPFHFFAMAFGWHGDALAWMAGKAALRYFKGDARREDDVFSFARYL